MMGIKSAESVKNEEKTAKNDEKLPKSDDLRPKNSLYDDIIDDLNKGRVRGSEVIDYTKFSSTPAKKEEVKEPKKVLNEHAYLITEDEYSDTHPEYDKKICIFKTDPEYDYQVFNAVNYEEEPDWGDWISKDVIQAALELEEGDEIWMRNESYGLDVCLIREES
jgi:hypothetical protein